MHTIYKQIMYIVELKISIYENMLKSYDNFNEFYEQSKEFT